MASQSIVSKIVSILGQLALAYLLLPNHFEAISLAYTVTAFASVLDSGGIREVLVHRGENFNDWVGSGFWLAVALGGLGSLMVFTAAPIVAGMYRNPEVGRLLIPLAAVPVLTSLSTIPISHLQNKQRFKEIALITAIQGLSQIIFTVIFAFVGLGAWSFVCGTLISLTLNIACSWACTRSEIQLHFDSAKLFSLWSDTWVLTATALVTTTVQQIDYITLGIFQKNCVGYYYFAFTIATQASQVLGSNLSTVFLPALCRVQSDPSRQLTSSLYAFRLLSGIGIPFAFLQAALVDSSFRLFLPAKWLPAIPFTQVLSFGLGLNILCSLCWSLLKAQGRFREILFLNTAGGLCFCLSVGVTAAFGAPIMVAWCVVAFCIIYAPIVLWMSIAKIGGTVSDVVNIFLTPAIASTLAFGVATFLDGLIIREMNNDVYRLPITALAFIAVYGLLVVIASHPIVEYSVQVTQRLWRYKAN